MKHNNLCFVACCFFPPHRRLCWFFSWNSQCSVLSSGHADFVKWWNMTCCVNKWESSLWCCVRMHNSSNTVPSNTTSVTFSCVSLYFAFSVHILTTQTFQVVYPSDSFLAFMSDKVIIKFNLSPFSLRGKKRPTIPNSGLSAVIRCNTRDKYKRVCSLKSAISWWAGLIWTSYLSFRV